MTSYHNDVVSLVWQIPCCEQMSRMHAQARICVSHGGSCRSAEMKWCHVRLCCCLYSAGPIAAKPEISKRAAAGCADCGVSEQIPEKSCDSRQSSSSCPARLHGNMLGMKAIGRAVTAACSAACVHCLHAIEPRS
jgi:hypothetical protein